MNLDEVFIPYLLNLFSSYLGDMDYSVQDAQDKGSDFFVEWLADSSVVKCWVFWFGAFLVWYAATSA